MPRSRTPLMISSAMTAIGVAMMVQGCELMVDTATDIGMPLQENAPVTVAPQPGVDLAHTEHMVIFDGNTSVLSKEEAGRLTAFMDKIQPAPTDRISVAIAPLPPSAPESQQLAFARRTEAVRGLLEDNGWLVKPLPADAAVVPSTRGDVTVVVRRYIVRLPACPDWSSSVWDNYDNQPGSNWGCATAINLGMSVANPRDLIQGRAEPVADGELLSRSIENYRNGETKELIRDTAASDTFAVSITDSGD